MASIVYASHAANLSGAPISLLLLCREMAARGHGTVFAAPGHGPLETLFQAGETLWPAKKAGLARWTPARNLCALARKKRFDLIHANCVLADYGAMAGKKAGLPVFWHIRERLDGVDYFTKKRIRTLADLVIVPSAELADRLAGQHIVDAHKIRIIENGVDVEAVNAGRAGPAQVKKRLGIPDKARVVGSVGTLCPRKDTKTFIRAMARVGARFPGAFFLVVGNPPSYAPRYGTQLKQLAKATGFRERFCFVPATAGVFDLMGAMDVFTLASTWEGMPRVVMEAMALGKPVVATTAGGTPGLVLDGVTGSLVPPKSPEKLARAVCALPENPEQARKMGDRAKKRIVTRFSLKRHADKMERLYARFL